MSKEQKRFSTATIICILIVAVGIFFRLAYYSNATSFWKDEVALAENFLDRDLGDIHKPLENTQAAPIGFMQLSKLAEMTWGHTEKVFWLLPFLSGIGILFWGWGFFRKALPKTAAVIALGLLAFDATLLKYCTQFKPYVSDVLFSLGLVATFWSASQSSPKARHYLAWLAMGLLALWMSYPSLFVIAGLGTWMIVSAIVQRKPRQAWGWIGVNAILAGVFITLWVTNYQYVDAAGEFHKYWIRERAFAPHNPEVLLWIPASLVGSIKFIFSEISGLFVLLLAFVGSIYAYHKDKRWVALLIPIALTYLASATQNYPVSTRLVLFWLPLVLPFVAMGTYFIAKKIKKKSHTLSILFIVFVLTPFVYFSFEESSKESFQEIRAPAMFIAQEAKAGDVVYCHPKSIELYEYYFRRYPLAKGVLFEYDREGNRWTIYETLKEKHPGKRVFFLASEPTREINELELLRGKAEEAKTLRNQMNLNISQMLLLQF